MDLGSDWNSGQNGEKLRGDPQASLTHAPSWSGKWSDPYQGKLGKKWGEESSSGALLRLRALGSVCRGGVDGIVWSVSHNPCHRGSWPPRQVTAASWRSDKIPCTAAP